MQGRTSLRGTTAPRFVLAAVLLFLHATIAPAATRFWRNSVGSSNWNNAANWSSVSTADTNAANNGIPLAAEPVNLTNTDGLARTITYDVASLFIGPLTVDLTGPGTTTETLSIGANALTVAGLFNVGNAGRGNVVQAGGAATSTSLFIGTVAGGVGDYALSNGSLSVTSGMNLGVSGAGSFNQSGGTASVTVDLTLGVNAASFGAFALTGGTFSTGASQIIGASATGNAGQSGGVFNHSGGSNSVGSGLVIASNIGSTGTYTLSGGGTLTVAQSETIGSNGKGIFNHTGGTHTINATATSFRLGANAGSSGTYNLSGSAVLTSNAPASIGGQGLGEFIQNGGTHTILGTSHNLTIGNSATAPVATYTLNSGNLAVSQSAVIVGNTGPATFTQTGGSNSTSSLQVAAGAGVTASYTLSGGGITATDQIIGGSGTATFTQTAGINTANFISIGAANANTSAGTYNLSGGSVTTGFVSLGSNTAAGATGILSVSGARVLSLSNVLTVYNSGTTQLNLAGGTINATTLNFDGAPGRFNWTSGTLNMKQDVTWDSGAASTTTSAAFGTARSLGNNQTLLVNGNETLGGVSTFALTLNSGSTHHVTGNLTITAGGSLTQNAGSSFYAGTITQAGGTINGTLFSPGNFVYQSGTFNGRLLNQGTATLGPSFVAANGVENSGSITLSTGQTLTVNGAGLDNWGSFTLSRGTISGSGPAINNLGGTLRAQGTINNNFTNSGILITEGLLRLNGASSTNNGIVRGSGTIIGNFTNVGEGNLDVLGSLTNNGAIGLEQGRSAFFFGHVSGSGSFTGPGTAVFLASLSPGNTTAAVSFGGNATLSAASSLNIELGGNLAGSGYDQLLVSGTLALGGTLNVSLINGFSPTAGQSFDILNWGILNGTFSTLNLPTIAGLAWNTSQLYTTGMLSLVVSAGIPGDYNNNGTVDAGDYIRWRKSQGTTNTLPNDPTGGTIGASQYDIWRSHFGQTASSGSATSTAVPEPAALLPVFIASVVVYSLNRMPRSRDG